LFRTNAAIRPISSARSFLQALISRPRNSTDVDVAFSQTERAIFERDATDGDISGDRYSWPNLPVSNEISLDRIRDGIAIKAQLICVSEGVLHLVFVRTKSDGRLLWVN